MAGALSYHAEGRSGVTVHACADIARQLKQWGCCLTENASKEDKRMAQVREKVWLQHGAMTRGRRFAKKA